MKPGDVMYIKFFDVGLYQAATTRRMHLRWTPPDREDAERGGSILCKQVVDVLERCLAHVRVLDPLGAKGGDRTGAAPPDSYYVLLWVADYKVIQQYRQKEPKKKEQKKREESARQPASSSQSGHQSWQQRNYESWQQGSYESWQRGSYEGWPQERYVRPKH